MSNYDQMTQRQQIQLGWNQAALLDLDVAVLSPGASAEAGWFCRYLAALGVGEISVVSRDVNWAEATSRAARRVNPFVRVRPVTVRDRWAPGFGGLSVSFRSGGESLEMLGGLPPSVTVSVSAGDVDVRVGHAPEAVRTSGSGDGAAFALLETLVHLIAESGAYPSITPLETFTRPSVPPAERKFALLALGCGALLNNLLAALHLAGLRPSCLHLVDHDLVDPTNLNRQILFTHADQGAQKVEVLASVALDLFPSCEVTAIPERFRPEHLDGFLRAAGSTATVVALLTDNWDSRLAASEAAGQKGVEALLFAGTTFDTARVRLFSPCLSDSWCLACGAENARIRAREERGPSCSRMPDASSVLPNLAAAAEGTALLNAWLGRKEYPLGGRNVSLVSRHRSIDGPVLAPCSCLGPPFWVGSLRAVSWEFPVHLERATPLKGLAREVSVVGAQAPGGSWGALVLLPAGCAASALGEPEPAAGALFLRSGEHCLVEGERLEYRGRVFSRRAETETRCAFCLDPAVDGVRVLACPEGHSLCAECGAEGSCPLCEAPRV